MEQIRMVPLEQLHPHEQNPRIDAASVTELVESIREHGIEVPLVAVPPYSGGSGWVVVAGHRRLTAAHELDFNEVPVQIRDDLTDARDQLAFMATENILRDQLTPMEESRLIQDMLDIGMTQTEVAKQTALGKQRVKDRMKLGKLAEETGEKVHRGQVSIDDALVIAEYTDDPESVKDLEASAGTPNFSHYVSMARRRREDRARITAAKKDAKKQGLRLADSIAMLPELAASGRWTTPTLKATAGDLADDAWNELLAIEHATCPGHAATVLSEYRWITGHGRFEAGTLIIGCDQHDTLHPDTDGPAQAEQSETEPDPWEEIPAEDFATAKIHRERHLAEALPHLDVADEAADVMTDAIVGQCWREYGDDEHAIALLEAITGHDGKSRARRKLKTWPLPLLVWLNKHWWNLTRQHRFQTEGRQGSTYWDEKGQLRQLLDRTGYDWTPAEQTAILLATGKAHDATEDPDTDGADNTDGAALAEGGEAA